MLQSGRFSAHSWGHHINSLHQGQMSKDWVDLTFFPFSFEWLCRLHFHFWNPRKLCIFISQALLPPLSHEIIDAWFSGLGHHSLSTLGYIFGSVSGSMAEQSGPRPMYANCCDCRLFQPNRVYTWTWRFPHWMGWAGLGVTFQSHRLNFVLNIGSHNFNGMGLDMLWPGLTGPLTTPT